MLHLPTPPQRLTLSSLPDLVRVIDEHPPPDGRDELPLLRALNARAATRASIACEYLHDGSWGRLTMTSLPFLSPPGEFIGVGNYLAPAAD